MRHLLLFLSTLTLLLAAPALKRVHTYTQNDGTTFEATPKGDEYLHFLQTKEGDILLYNPKTKNYDYATIRNDRLVPSGSPYRLRRRTPLRQSAAEQRHPPHITSKQLRERHKKAKKRFLQHR